MPLLACMLMFLMGSVAHAASEIPAFFPQLTLLLLLAGGAAYLSFRLGLVPIIGFLFAGVLAGPSVLGLIRDPALINAASEIGVILLLFAIGIEFSLERLGRIGRLIFVGGGLQVGLVVGITTLALVGLGVSLQNAIFTGFLLALSSTAIVMKLLSDRNRTGSEVGGVSLGILIFQDLAVVVMVLLVPLLGGQGGGPLDLLWALGKAAALVVLTLVFARRIMPIVLDAVARTCSPEIFLLTVVAICFGTAYVSSLAGVSLSLGAFLAGLVVSESRFGRQALGEILPLQILFSAAFFVSVGLLLDVGYLWTHLPVVLGALLVFVLLKVVTTALGVRLLGYGWPTALGSGLLLAQVGEFSFVLERTGRDVGLTPAGLGPDGTQAFIAATVLLMAATPTLARLGETLGARLEARRPTDGAAPTATPSEDHDSPLGHLRGHVLIAGYGPQAGRLAGALERAGTPFGILTLSPGGAEQARERGWPVMIGDYSRPYTLALAGADRARAVLVPDDEPEMAGRVVSVVRGNYPDLHVVARAEDTHAAELLGAGASRVVTGERELTLGLLAETLNDDTPRARLRAHLDGDTARTTRFVGLDEVDLTDAQRSGTCTHVPAARRVVPRTDGCEECLRTGSRWVHLRVCLTCGHVGCCDSSEGKHASAHHHATNHPVMRSLEPGEDWAWCYVDGRLL